MRSGFNGFGLAVPLRYAAVACLALVVVGCGPSGSERAVVSGKVTFHGVPLKSGEIRFIPIKGTEGPMWGALIADGQYTADGKGGVPVGTHRIEILATSTKGPSEGGRGLDGPPRPGMNAASRKPYIPAKYNRQSTLEITIEPGSGGIVKDFALTN